MACYLSRGTKRKLYEKNTRSHTKTTNGTARDYRSPVRRLNACILTRQKSADKSHRLGQTKRRNSICARAFYYCCRACAIIADLCVRRKINEVQNRRNASYVRYNLYILVYVYICMCVCVYGV